MAINTSGGLSNFLKFIKKKPDQEHGLLRCPSPKLGYSSPSVRRRHQRTHSFDSAILEDASKEDFNNDLVRLRKSSSKPTRRKSFTRKHLSLYNNEDLYNAVVVENVELTRRVLCCENIDVNFCGTAGWTVLHHACRLGNIDIIKLLLDKGAHVTCETVEGYSPLRLTVFNGHFDAAAYLIHDGGAGCDEIRDGFQDIKPYILQSTTASLMKHAKIVKTKSID